MEAFLLNDFSTKFRYPGDELEPTLEEVERAVVNAERILTFVKAKINQ